MSKQIDPLRNTDRQKRSNIYHVIGIGCHFDKNAYKFKPLELHVIAFKCSTCSGNRKFLVLYCMLRNRIQPPRGTVTGAV